MAKKRVGKSQNVRSRLDKSAEGFIVLDPHSKLTKGLVEETAKHGLTDRIEPDDLTDPNDFPNT